MNEVKSMPKSTHDGIVKIGNLELKCSKLDNGMTVIEKESFEEFMVALQNGELLKNVSDEELREFASKIKGNW